MEITHDYLVGKIQTTTHDVLSLMAGIQVTCRDGYRQPMDGAGVPCEPEAGSKENMNNGDSVEAFVSISGPMVGTGTVSCDTATACRLASAMLMTDVDGVGTEVLDAMGEIANMIVGNVKSAIEDRAGQLWLSVPSVIYGRNFTARTVGNFEWTVVPCEIPNGRLRVRFCLGESGQNRNGHVHQWGLTPGGHVS